MQHFEKKFIFRLATAGYRLATAGSLMKGEEPATRRFLV
jgi:hypothetical protein